MKIRGFAILLASSTLVVFYNNCQKSFDVVNDKKMESLQRGDPKTADGGSKDVDFEEPGNDDDLVVDGMEDLPKETELPTPTPAPSPPEVSDTKLVPPVKPSCGSIKSIPSSSSQCVGSPTEKILKSFQCTANNNSTLTNAKPCSQRYGLKWKMDLRASDKGRYAVDVLKERHKNVLLQSVMYCSACPASQNLNKAITVDIGPEGKVALQRNIEPGIVPSSSFAFTNFPEGSDRICISMDVYVPSTFVGNEAGYKLGYGIWGGNQPSGGGTSPVVQKAKKGFVVRNTWNEKETALYSYHLNRGGSGRWANQNEAKCDNETCCIYGDSSKAGTVTKGKWVHIEQEVVLNTMDKTDGYARLWVDGKQAGEITNMLIYEKEAKLKIKGLLINDMWGGNIAAPNHQAKTKENYWLTNYTVYY